MDGMMKRWLSQVQPQHQTRNQKRFSRKNLRDVAIYVERLVTNQLIVGTTNPTKVNIQNIRNQMKRREVRPKSKQKIRNRSHVFKCKKIGHYANECQSKEKQDSSSASASTTYEFIMLCMDVNDHQENDEDESDNEAECDKSHQDEDEESAKDSTKQRSTEEYESGDESYKRKIMKLDSKEQRRTWLLFYH